MAVCEPYLTLTELHRANLILATPTTKKKTHLQTEYTNPSSTSLGHLPKIKPFTLKNKSLTSQVKTSVSSE